MAKTENKMLTIKHVDSGVTTRIESKDFEELQPAIAQKYTIERQDRIIPAPDELKEITLGHSSRKILWKSKTL